MSKCFFTLRPQAQPPTDNSQQKYMEIGTWIDLGILIVAIVAAAFSFREIQSNNVAERNKLLSQLNRRYLNSNDIQAVVKSKGTCNLFSSSTSSIWF